LPVPDIWEDWDPIDTLLEDPDAETSGRHLHVGWGYPWGYPTDAISSASTTAPPSLCSESNDGSDEGTLL
jgi:hypothetical protein